MDLTCGELDVISLPNQFLLMKGYEMIDQKKVAVLGAMPVIDLLTKEFPARECAMCDQHSFGKSPRYRDRYGFVMCESCYYELLGLETRLITSRPSKPEQTND